MTDKEPSWEPIVPVRKTCRLMAQGFTKETTTAYSSSGLPDPDTPIVSVDDPMLGSKGEPGDNGLVCPNAVGEPGTKGESGAYLRCPHAVGEKGSEGEPGVAGVVGFVGFVGVSGL